MLRSSFVLLSAAVMLVVGCGKQFSPKGIQIDKEMRSIVWPEATALVGVDFQSLKKTQVYQRYGEQIKIPGLDETSDQTGFDPRRDVKMLLLESDGTRMLVAAQGEFDKVQGKQRGGKSTFALLSNKFALAGSSEAVRSGTELRVKHGGGIAPALQTRLEALPKSAQVWVVSSKGVPFMQLPMRSDVQSALSNIVAYIAGTSASLQVDSGLVLRARLDCVSAAGAQRVNDAMRGAIGMARLSTRDDQSDWLKLYDAIEVRQAGNAVEVNAKLGGNEIDELSKVLPQLRSRVTR